MSASTFFSLPPEIIWCIISLLSPLDLSNTRLVCRKLLSYCDHPSNWKNIQLQPLTMMKQTNCSIFSSPDSSQSSCNNNNMETLYLWNLSDLKSILEPHLLLIQKIEIWGVRDNIIRYLILHCPNLQDLTISGWNTLSDHALRIPAQDLRLRRLRLVGRKKSNYTSVDATTFGNLIARCPLLEELSVVQCQVHIQADSLLNSFDSLVPTQERQNHMFASPSSLRSLTVATKRTWSGQHVKRLFQLCSNLCFLALVPDSKSIFEGHQVDNTEVTTKPTLMDDGQPVLEKSVLSIDEEEMENSNNIVIYSI